MLNIICKSKSWQHAGIYHQRVCGSEEHMTYYLIIGIIGIISGILCAQADVPLAWSGRREDALDAKAVGRISPWWTSVREGHFDLSFWLSCIGQPGTYLTTWALAELMSERNAALGILLKICTFIGAYTGLLFHAAACIKPLVYRAIAQEVTQETAQSAMDAIDKYPRLPSLICGIVLFLGETVILVIAVLTGALAVPKWFALCNPVCILPVMLAARKLNLRIGGALGIGSSLLGVVLIVAGLHG